MTADEFKAARDQLGWTNARLAKELGITERALYRWYKTGNIPGPAITAIKLMLEKNDE